MKNKHKDIHGLILSGGDSARMGQNKAFIRYHDKPQYEYVYDLLSPLLPNIFLSVKSEKNPYNLKNQIVDKFDVHGPLNGILSAMDFDREAAWLVLPCDLPLLTQKSISKLIRHRDPEKTATCFKQSNSSFPEPLAAIWEPKAYPGLMETELKTGSNSPVRFLLDRPTKYIQPYADTELTNCNTLEDYERALKIISGKS